MRKIYFLIPTYNEGDVSQLVLELKLALTSYSEWQINVLFVDDGSSVPTFCTIQDSPNFQIKISKLPQNLGPGGAFAHAFSTLPSGMSDSDIVILLEGDGTSNPNLISKMIHRLYEIPDGFDLVLASPYAFGGSLKSLSLFRRILSSIANESSRLILDLRGLWTLSSFFRVFRGSSVNKLQDKFGAGILLSAGFESMLELLVKCRSLNFSMSEVASTVDQDNRTGRSRMKILKTIIGYLRVWNISRRI